MKGEKIQGKVTKADESKRVGKHPYTTLACGFAMIAFVISEYSAADGTFQSYIGALDLIEMLQRTEFDYLELLENNTHEVARYLSSRTKCSCIPSELTCPHGFPTPPSSADPIHIFRREYANGLIEEINEKKGTKSITIIHDNICKRLHKMGLSHLWDNEEKAKRISSALVSFGTDCIQVDDTEWWTAAIIAISVKTLELTGSLSPPETHSDILSSHKWLVSQPEMAKFMMDSLVGDKKRELSKFFLKRNGCSCLKQKYKDIKAEQPKQGACAKCNEFKDRAKLMLCQGCKVMNYCSKKCQRADWANHKEYCRAIAEVSGYEDDKVE